MGSARLRLATGAAALGLLASAAACARTTVWQERWELTDASTAGAERTGTFGFSWTDSDHTRGEYGFTFTVAGTADPRASETWHVQGMFTAEQYSPDFCGRAKWTAGSTCLAFNLWPRGDEPPGPIQAHLDQLGLPDRAVHGYLLFLDGRTNELSLMRNSDNAVETRWEYARSAK